MSSNLALSIKLTTEGGQIVVKELTQIGQAAGTTNKELVNTGNAGSAAKKGLDEAGSSATQLNSYMTTLKATAGLLLGSLSAMSLIDTADNWGQMASRIRQATESSDEYNYVQQRMVDSANDTYRSITETREGFVMMSPILRDMNYNLGQSIDIVDSFSALLVTNAANAERGASAQAALTKSIQSGRVEADAWQTIFGVMPSILDNITSATGKTGAEIRQLGVTGKLSITDLTNALLLGYESNLKAVEQMPTTVRDAMTKFSNVFSNYIGLQNEASGTTAAMADGIVYLSENLDTLATIAGGVLAAAVVRYSTLTVMSTAKTLADIRAKQAATLQELRLAQAQAVQTKATLAQAAVMARIAGAHGQAAVAAEAHRAAVQRLTAAKTAHITVGRSVLGLLGGPAGLALTAGIAATAFLSFYESSEDVRASLSDLQQPLDQLINKYQQLNDDQRAAALVKWANAEQQAIADTNAAFQDLVKSFGSWQFTGLNTEQRSGLVRELAAAKAAGESLTPILQRVGAEAGVSPKTIQDWVKLAGTFADNKAAAEQAAKAIKAVNEAGAAPAAEVKANLPTAENKELAKAILDVYNAQLLAATAVDAYGVSLNGIDLELFKAEFVALTALPDDAAAAIKRFADEAKTAQANLEISTYSTELSKQIALMDVRLAKGEQEYELQKALAQFTGADPARLSALQAELAIMQQKQALAADRTTLASLTKENDLLMVRLAHGQQEYELQKALAELKGQDPAVLAAIEAELRLRQQLTEQITISEEIASSAFSNALDDMTALSSAGEQFGDALTQAFGRVAQQINGMTAAQVHYNTELAKLAKEKERVNKLDKSPEKSKALLDIQRTEARLSKEHFQAQIGQYAALTGAAAQMFGEQSKEREKLHKLEQAFSVIEMALAMERAAANALAAIANQGSGDPYTAFARIAAMAALMAGLGLFSGSASGNANMSADRQASQGTGTVLGDSDAKSASIANTLERIETLELDQYVELRAINSNIKALSNGIANLAVSLVSNFGKFNEQSYSGQLGTEKQFQLNDSLASIVALGPLGGAVDQMLGGIVGNIFNSVLGGISKTTKSLLDSGIAFEAQKLGDIIATGLVDASYYNVVETTKRKLWGLSKKKSTNTEYTALDRELEAEFGRIFGFLGSSITAAIDVLGVDVSRSLDNFVINLPNISFKDLSGDEIAKELEAVFSQQADLMAKYVLPSISQYQQMGEGLYDTLIRVAQEQAIFNAQLDALGLQLADVSAALRIDVAQSIIELMGGIEAFRDATSEYFSAFYSEAEQFDYLSQTIRQAMAAIGLSVPATRDGFKSMVDAIDLTTEAGQQLFAQLMALVPGLDEYYKALEKQKDAAQAAADAELKLAEQRRAMNEENSRQLTRLSFSPLQLAMDDLQQWYINAVTEAQDAGADIGMLTDIYNKKREQLAEQTLQSAVTTAQTAMSRLVAEYDRGVGALAATLQQHINAITSMTQQLAGDALAIRKTLPGFDNVSYYTNQVNSLRGQMGTGDTAAQLDLVGKLRSAINDRYSAELAYIEQQNNLINEQYSLQLEQFDAAMDTYKALVSAAEAMREAAAALLINDLSPLTAGQRLTEARSQFDTALAAARGGDADAYAMVQSLGQQILQMSRDYNPAAYSDVFGDIKAVFDELGGFDAAEPTAPAPHPAMAAYEAEKIALAERTIAELVALQGHTAALQPLAQAEYDAGVEALKAEFATAAAEVTAVFEQQLTALQQLMPSETDRVVTKLQEQIDALYSMSNNITGAIAQQPGQFTEAVVALPPPQVVVPPDLVDVIIKRPPISIQPVPPETFNPLRDEIRQLQNKLQQQMDQQAANSRAEQQKLDNLYSVSDRNFRETISLNRTIGQRYLR